jgi:hypothetical protein
MLIDDLIRKLEDKKKLYGNVLVIAENKLDQKKSYNGIFDVELINCELINPKNLEKSMTEERVPVVVLS